MEGRDLRDDEVRRHRHAGELTRRRTSHDCRTTRRREKIGETHESGFPDRFDVDVRFGRYDVFWAGVRESRVLEESPRRRRILEVEPVMVEGREDRHDQASRLGGW